MEYLRELPEIDEKAYEFFQKIQLKTWVLIDGNFNLWYHDSGDYFQIEIDCKFLDGCGETKNGTIYQSVASDEADLIEIYLRDYLPGSVHLIESDKFNIDNHNVTFYHPKTTAVKHGLELHPLEWFSDFGKIILPVESNHNNSIISGTIYDIRVINTKSAKKIAFVKLTEHAETLLIIFATQYIEYFKILKIGNYLNMLGVMALYADIYGAPSMGCFCVMRIQSYIDYRANKSDAEEC